MNILFATDGSAHAHAAAATLQRLPVPTTSTLTILTVITPTHLAMATDIDALDREAFDRLYSIQRQAAEQLLAQTATGFETTDWTVRTMLREGNVAQQIFDTIEELGTQLVVVGARGLSGMARFFLGSVSQKLVKYAPCSVLVGKLPHDEVSTPTPSPTVSADARLRMVLAYDDSASSQEIVHTLAALPLRDTDEITITTVLTLVTSYRLDIMQQLSAAWQDEKRAAQDELDRIAQILRDATAAVVTTQLREGADASEEIMTAAKEAEADLIVIGHRGRGSVERYLLGSVANRVAHYAPCTVWVVRQ